MQSTDEEGCSVFRYHDGKTTRRTISKESFVIFKLSLSFFFRTLFRDIVYVIVRHRFEITSPGFVNIIHIGFRVISVVFVARLELTNYLTDSSVSVT